MEDSKDICDFCDLKSPDVNGILHFLEERFNNNSIYVSYHDLIYKM